MLEVLIPTADYVCNSERQAHICIVHFSVTRKKWYNCVSEHKQTYVQNPHNPPTHHWYTAAALHFTRGEFCSLKNKEIIPKKGQTYIYNIWRLGKTKRTFYRNRINAWSHVHPLSFTCLDDFLDDRWQLERMFQNRGFWLRAVIQFWPHWESTVMFCLIIQIL